MSSKSTYSRIVCLHPCKHIGKRGRRGRPGCPDGRKVGPGAVYTTPYCGRRQTWSRHKLVSELEYQVRKVKDGREG
jgi:hypothetical protein